MASKGYKIVLYGIQTTFEEEHYELCYTAGFSERGIPGCSTIRSIQPQGRTISCIYFFQSDLFVKTENDMGPQLIFL